MQQEGVEIGSPADDSIRAELDRALNVGSYREACRLTASLKRLDRISALRLTVLAAQEDAAAFNILARDWIFAALAAGELRPKDLLWFIPQMQKVQEGGWCDGERLVLVMRHRQAQ